jgi:hypothetical protein
MRNNHSYRGFYARIRRSTDTRAIGELMKQAYEARQTGEISVKHFIALNAAASNQRERLLSAPLSAAAFKLIKEIVMASEKKLRYLGWTTASIGDSVLQQTALKDLLPAQRRVERKHGQRQQGDERRALSRRTTPGSGANKISTTIYSG